MRKFEEGLNPPESSLLKKANWGRPYPFLDISGGSNSCKLNLRLLSEDYNSSVAGRGVGRGFVDSWEAEQQIVGQNLGDVNPKRSWKRSTRASTG
jgi:hypothetical protein